ncbi:MAG: inositol monophosphatase family protein [Cyanobacteria bacterium P01_A01_bin.17]
MMPPVSAEQAQLIRTLLRQVGQQAKRMATQPFDVSAKGPEDFVTSVDRALDRQLSTQFRTWFPDDGLITEENAQSVQAFRQSHMRLWLIDPIDGTEDFMHGRPNYAVMVGLLQNNQPTAGWVYSPARDQLYWGGPNWGLFQTSGPKPVQPLLAQPPPPPSPDFCPIMIGERDRKNYGTVLKRQIPAAQFQGLGSFGLKVMEVIQGRAGLYLYLNGRVKLWDTTGPLALARAAGLVCCDLEGKALQFTADQLNLDTLAHQQAILVAWPHYFEALQQPIQAAVSAA